MTFDYSSYVMRLEKGRGSTWIFHKGVPYYKDSYYHYKAGIHQQSHYRRASSGSDTGTFF